MHEPTFQPMQGAAFIFYLLYNNKSTEILSYLKRYSKQMFIKAAQPLYKAEVGLDCFIFRGIILAKHAAIF